MRIDAAHLRRAAPDVVALASSVDATLSRLVSTLDAEVGCWGTDGIGSAFAASYVPAADTVRQALADLRDVVRAVGDAVLAVAGNAEAAEGRTQLRFG